MHVRLQALTTRRASAHVVWLIVTSTALVGPVGQGDCAASAGAAGRRIVRAIAASMPDGCCDRSAA